VKREIKIFKSFEEQEQYHLDEMRKTTPLERFRNLFELQQLTKAFHPPADKSRKIVIQKNGYSQ
jgi:hypothetical protein